jgi:kynurenine formamidase
MRPEKFDMLAEKLRNWGRWGSDDQKGTLNLIDGAALMRATKAVTVGKRFSLGLGFDKNGPQDGSVRFNPIHYMKDIGTKMNAVSGDAGYSDDVVILPLQCSTQWDALGHVYYDGLLYNGCKACDVLSVHGASKNSIEHMATPGLMSRGILLDIARLKGVEILPTNYAITVDDLNAACAKQGVKVESGDIVLVRTGQIRRFTVENNRAAWAGEQAGLSHLCAEWLHEKSVAAVCADNVAVEIIAYAELGVSERPLPLHLLCLRDMGMPLGEIFNLEELAADCATDKRYSFLIAAPPLGITGGLGSPVNPVVLK